jgi:hypothetical protein
MPICHECGLRTAEDEPDCAGLFSSMNARHFEQPALYGRFHRLAVDAYCVQHSPYVKSAKSLAAHLCGLSIAFELGGDDHAIRRLQQWLNANRTLTKPELPRSRGELKIDHLNGIDDPAAYGRAIQEWARSAWDAYRSLHPVAREWIALSTRTSTPH